MVHRRGIAALAVAWSVLAAPAVAAPASASFTSESPFSTTHDDWEPSVAADGAGHVYWATTRYGIKALCQTCPPHRIVLKVSDDDGETWSAPQTICRCAGFKYFQNDPVLAVDGQGRVYATMLNNFNVTVQRSDDFGETWSHRVLVHERKDWGDKPWIDVSEDGWDVYVSYNGKPNGAAWGAASHDGGQTWEEPVRMSGGSRYWFAGGMTITPNGTALTSQIAQHQNSKGDTQVVVFRSIDDGESWERVDLDVAEQLRPCPPYAGCNEFGFFSAWNAIAADDAARVRLLQPERRAGGTVAAAPAVLRRRGGDVVGADRRLPSFRRRRRAVPYDRVDRRWGRPGGVDGRPDREMEHVVPPLHGRRVDVVLGGPAVRPAGRRAVQVQVRLPVPVRGLRTDGDRRRGPDARDLGRGTELCRPRRHLVRARRMIAPAC